MEFNYNVKFCLFNDVFVYDILFWIERVWLVNVVGI